MHKSILRTNSVHSCIRGHPYLFQFRCCLTLNQLWMVHNKQKNALFTNTLQGMLFHMTVQQPRRYMSWCNPATYIKYLHQMSWCKSGRVGFAPSHHQVCSYFDISFDGPWIRLCINPILSRNLSPSNCKTVSNQIKNDSVHYTNFYKIRFGMEMICLHFPMKLF